MFAEKLPKNIRVENTKETNFFVHNSKWKSFGLIECAIWYNRPLVLQALLKISHYKEYAHTNASDLGVCALSVGSLEMAKVLLKSKGFKIEHLHLALEYCNNNDCKELLSLLLKNYTPKNILDYKNEEENTILHLVALYGRKRFLLDLAKLNVFDFSNGEKERLLQKNNDGYCPFVIAVQMNHLDISSALFVLPQNIMEIHNPEIEVLESSKDLIKTLTQFMDPKAYPIEAELWNKIFPKKSEILNLIAKFRLLDGPLQTSSKNEDAKSNNKDNLLLPLIEYMKEGNVMLTLSFILFRRDALYIAALLPSPEKLKANVLDIFKNNMYTMPFTYIFSRIGLCPNNGDELVKSNFLRDISDFDEKYALFCIQHFNIIANNTAKDRANIQQNSGNLLAAPYNYFTGNRELKINDKVDFTHEEVNLLVPIQNKVKKQYYNLDLASLALEFAEKGYYNCFLTIAIYGNKYNTQICENIRKKINIEELFIMISQKYNKELPVFMELLQVKLKYDITEKHIKVADTTLIIPCSHDSMVSLLYLAITGKLGSGDNIIKSVLSVIVVDMLKIYYYGGNGPVGDNVKKIISLNEAKRLFNTFYEIIVKAFKQVNRKTKLMEFVKVSPPKVVIGDRRLAELILDVLTNESVIFFSPNTFIMLRFNKENLLHLAGAISKASNCSLAESVALLFTEKHLLGINEIKNSRDKYLLYINISLFDNSSKPLLDYKVNSVTKEDFNIWSSIDNSPFVADIDEKYRVDIELYINIDHTKLKSTKQAYTQLNNEIYRTIIISTLDYKNITLKDPKGNFHRLLLDKKSVSENLEELEECYPVNTLDCLESICVDKLEQLLHKITFYYNDIEILVPQSKESKETERMRFPGTVEEFAEEVLKIRTIDTYKIVIVKEAIWNNTKPPLDELILNVSKKYRNTDNELELKFIIPSEKGKEQQTIGRLTEELYPEYLLGRILKGEVSLIKQLMNLFEESKPDIRFDIKSFLDQIVIPISKTTNTRYSNPLNFLEDIFTYSNSLFATSTELMVHIYNIMKKFKRNISSIFIQCERREGTAVNTATKDCPLVDKLISLVDCRIKANGSICIITFIYMRSSDKSTLKPANTQVNRPLIHRMKVLEALITESELLSEYLHRKDINLKVLSKSLSNIFGKSIKTTINWNSLYSYLDKAIKDKSKFEKLIDYYDYVIQCLM